METLKLNTAREVKRLGRKNIKSINGIYFSGIYPMLSISNKHISYYSVEEQGNIYLYEPYVVEVK